jgi:hypothetical protein
LEDLKGLKMQLKQSENLESNSMANMQTTDKRTCKHFPLTDEEIAEVAERMEATDAASSFWREFARAIEAAHGIKE